MLIILQTLGLFWNKSIYECEVIILWCHDFVLQRVVDRKSFQNCFEATTVCDTDQKLHTNTKIINFEQFWQSDIKMTSCGHYWSTCASKETWISSKLFKTYIWSNFQVFPRWVPRNFVYKHIYDVQNTTYKASSFKKLEMFKTRLYAMYGKMDLGVYVTACCIWKFV